MHRAPDLVGTVGRVALVKVEEALQRRRRALGVAVLDHDVVCMHEQRSSEQARAAGGVASVYVWCSACMGVSGRVYVQNTSAGLMSSSSFEPRVRSYEP